MNKNTYTESKIAFSKSHPHQSGFSLIEIMIAALILSIGILGVVGLQVVGLKGTQQSFMKQQAMSVVQNLTERMRSNTPGVLAGDYELSATKTLNCGTAIPACSDATSNCSSADIAKADLHNLVCGYKTATSSRTGGLRNIAADDISTFINGGLTVTCTDNCTTGNMSIEVNWTERQFGDEEPGLEDSLVINTRILP